MRALRHAGRRRRHLDAVVLPHHAVRRRAAEVRRHRLARARARDADELDRPLRGRRDRLRGRGPRRRRRSRSSRRDRTRSTARRSWCWRPSIRWSTTITTPAQRAEVEAYVERDAQRDGDRADLGGAREDRRLHRRVRRQRVHRRARPDLDRRLRAVDVRDRRDHGRARRTTSATSSSRRSTASRSARSSRPDGTEHDAAGRGVHR